MNTTSTQSESEQILSVLGSVLQRRKTLLVACLFGVLALVFYYNQTTPPVYEAAASVVFEESHDPLPDDASRKLSWELFLSNRIEEINSRAFSEDIAAALPQESLARFPMSFEMTRLQTRMRYVSTLLDESISAYPLHNSNIVRIRVRLSDARLCLLVANLCLSVLEERSGQLRNKDIANLQEFVQGQLARSAAELAVSEGDLARFKEAHGITSLVDDSREMLKRLTEAEILYNATVAEVGAVTQRLKAVRETIASQREGLVPTVTSVAGSSTQTLRDKLIGLEAQQAQLSLQKYPHDHPEAVRLRQEIEQTRKTLTEEAMKLAKANDIGDPVPRIERRLEEAVSLQIELEGLAARARALEQPVRRYRTWLDSLPEKEMELARLERNRDANQKEYMTQLQRREEIRIAAAKQLPNSRVIDRPLLPVEPVEPRKLLNLALGVALGLFIGFGLGFLLESWTGRLGSMVDFEQTIGWPVLARIPHVRGGPVGPSRLHTSIWWRPGADAKGGKSLAAIQGPESAASAAYSMLRTRLGLLGVGTKYRSLLVTSCGPGDGKSSTLCNLAATLGAAGRATVVVDAEFRRPTIHAVFGVGRSPGLADLLLSRNGDGDRYQAGEKATPGPPDEGKGVVAPSEESFLQKTQFRRVAVLASGNLTQESSWEISWTALREVLEDLKRKYEIVLVDSPPAALVHDALMLCGMVDAVVVVVDARSYNPQQLLESKIVLERAGANVIGAVLNRISTPGGYTYGYRRDRIPKIST